jgi:hypothetical protein
MKSVGVLWAVGLMSLAVSAAAHAVPETVNDPATGVATAQRVQPPMRSFSIVAAGDLLTEGVVNSNASRHATAAGLGERFDYRPIFQPIADIVSAADLAICHMEIPIGRPAARYGVMGKSPFGGNLLLAPYELADDLRATGFDRCTTASNHSYDLGIDGIATTLEALTAARISATGTARTPLEQRPGNLTVNGVQVANLSYAVSSNTGFPADAWRVNRGVDVNVLAADVRAVRAAGAEVVIVSLHLKQEMLKAPTAADRDFVSRLTAAVPIDLVVQHGPHVVQPVERVNGAVVYWSVGNLLSGMGLPGRGKYSDVRALDGLLATVRFTERAAGGWDADVATVLVCNERTTRTIYSATRVLADPSASADLRTQADACLRRSAASVRV